MGESNMASYRRHVLFEYRIPQSAVDNLPSDNHSTADIIDYYVSFNGSHNKDEGSAEAAAFLFLKRISFLRNEETEMGAIYCEFLNERQEQTYDHCLGGFHDWAFNRYNIELVDKTVLDIPFNLMNSNKSGLIPVFDGDENLTDQEQNPNWAARLALVEDIAINKKGYIKR
jgi:hypothetical protein